MFWYLNTPFTRIPLDVFDLSSPSHKENEIPAVRYIQSYDVAMGTNLSENRASKSMI